MIRHYFPHKRLDDVEMSAQEHTHDADRPDARAMVVEVFTGEEPDDDTPGHLYLLLDESVDAFNTGGVDWLNRMDGTAYDTTDATIHADLHYISGEESSA